jgi:dTDP-4-dehydrorhamnose 3,5-epimerase-like enzyme
MENATMAIKGGIAVDDRGSVSFVNDFPFGSVKRSYIVRNHSKNFVRAWHYHYNEGKYVRIIQGSAILGAVCGSPKSETWDTPTKLVISEYNPSVVYIPPGYANGFMSLTDNCIIEFYSTSTLQESLTDDVRIDARKWDIWKIEER